MIGWEYKVEQIRLGLGKGNIEDLNFFLNDCGKQGWDLVSADWEGDQVLCIFKRVSQVQDAISGKQIDVKYK